MIEVCMMERVRGLEPLGIGFAVKIKLLTDFPVVKVQGGP
jgi:hypothetical protein